MTTIKVYIPKDDLDAYVILPKPKDLSKFYEVEVEEDYINKLPLHYSYSPETGKFEPSIERYNKRVLSRRKTAYEKEADPLYKEWQYELSIGSDKAEDARKAWLEKIEEIKQRHPKAETL